MNELMNEFMVGAAHDGLVILSPPRKPMTRMQALGLAAFLVMMAEPFRRDGEPEWEQILHDAGR